VLYQPSFYEPLLVKPLFVFQNLDGHILFFLVVEATEYHTKRAFSALLLDFVPKSQVLVHSDNVLILVVVKSVVRLLIVDAIVALSTRALAVHAAVLLLLPFFDREPVDGLKFKDLALFNVPQVRTQRLECFVGSHWEPAYVACRSAILLVSQSGEFGVDQFVFVLNNASLGAEANCLPIATNRACSASSWRCKPSRRGSSLGKKLQRSLTCIALASPVREVSVHPVVLDLTE